MTEMVEYGDSTLPLLERAPFRLTVTRETILYVIIGMLALLVRLAELDTIPLGNAEAYEALAAWHFVSPTAPGTAPVASSPVLFMLNSLFMALMGGTELAARLATALGGTALVLLPALWRRELGRVAALLTTLLLSISTAELVAARTMSPVVWAMIAVGVGLALFVRYGRTGNQSLAVGSAVMMVATVLLADPAGIAILIALGIAWLVVNRLSVDDAPEVHPAPRLRMLLATWPWRDSLAYGVGAVLTVGSVFMFFPGGLTHVGELLGRGLAGFVVRPVGQPFAFPLLVSLVYEPALWLLGILGIRYALREGDLVDRFLVGAVAGGLIMAVVYAGAGPAHALWLVVPLAAISGRTLARVLAPVRDALWQVPNWAVSLLAAGFLALLFVSATNFVWVARALLGAGPGVAPAIQPLRLVLAGMSLLLLGILFFLGASLWGTRAAWRSLTLAFAVFFAFYGASSAWRVAETHVDDPHELWHVAPVDRELAFLREAISEASLRETGGPFQLAFVANGPDDGAVAWQLRDYGNLRYVPAIDQREAAPVIVAPETFDPDTLGARYVGREMIVHRTWDLGSLRWEDLPAWLMYGEAQSRPVVSERVVLWVREDVYGLPPAGDEVVPQ